MAKKILIADIDENDLQGYKEAFEEEEFDVVTVRSGRQALELAALGPLPDLAVIFVDLPDVSGLHVAQELQSLGVSSIFLSRVAHKEMVDQARYEGALGYLVKPVKPFALVAAVHVALDLANELRDLEISRERLSAAQKLNQKISLAIGIYMAQYHLSEDQAFEEIRAYARSQRMRLATLCQEIVEGHNRAHRLLGCIKEHCAVKRRKDSKSTS
ncbi:ANTAR domain-containing response regulator [endosymbiont of unidentified scaly snail isolate Monju]|uniref:ANTAR domain-containing response regulator n=1 Tax=endosymbiont of unidentified scaly snail isolate Monju TaxID=1248727 RepID=UPI0003892515|nr:response regulator [endosymbiont of unidentified scaly snail isolate Monju]BAN70154.1 response regulator NasT [endosymbiont of unidentified scaly snail isolate Monju]